MPHSCLRQQVKIALAYERCCAVVYELLLLSLYTDALLSLYCAACVCTLSRSISPRACISEVNERIAAFKAQLDTAQLLPATAQTARVGLSVNTASVSGSSASSSVNSSPRLPVSPLSPPSLRSQFNSASASSSASSLSVPAESTSTSESIEAAVASLISTPVVYTSFSTRAEPVASVDSQQQLLQEAPMQPTLEELNQAYYAKKNMPWHLQFGQACQEFWGKLTSCCDPSRQQLS
jgi:hypothetical protein